MKKLLGFILAFSFSISVIAAEEPLNEELRESIYRVNVTVTDMFSRTETRPVVITVFRPPGEGKYPLLILNHGRAIDTKRYLQGRQRYLNQMRWFISKGFVVMIPTRIGYGETYGDFDPEFDNACLHANLQYKNEALLKQISAVYDFAKTQDYVDPSKWVIAGQSMGGYASITIAKNPLPGLVGAINFSAGLGGNPETRRGNPCGSAAWERELEKPVSSTVPTLWLYWKNDWYMGPTNPPKWFKAFQAGNGNGEFVHFPEIKGDGHGGFARDMKSWTPIVDNFLSKLPLKLQAVAIKQPTPTPPPTNYAAIDDVDKVPFLSIQAREVYKEFINLRESPRAFAINAEGRWGWSSSHYDSADRALSYCNKRATSPCKLYVVDDDVVWKAE